jgi:RNA polymerase sigma factor (sigma-70 family)
MRIRTSTGGCAASRIAAAIGFLIRCDGLGASALSAEAVSENRRRRCLMGEMADREATQGPETTADVADAYRQHRNELTRFATVLVGPDHAHDVVSAAVVRVLDNSPTSLSHPRAYLYQAVANQARNFKRGEARRRTRETQGGASRQVVFQPEPYPEVLAAVEQLSVRQRAVVYLTYWEDMTDQAIGEHLGIGSGTVRRHLARARRHLRRALK